MGCCGKHRRAVPAEEVGGKLPPRPRPADYFIGPFEPCVFCAEKHLSEAWELARECGYEFPNRQTIIGGLGNCARHLWREHPRLAEKVRAFRHRIQRREEGGADWRPLLKEVDELAAAEALTMKKE